MCHVPPVPDPRPQSGGSLCQLQYWRGAGARGAKINIIWQGRVDQAKRTMTSPCEDCRVEVHSVETLLAQGGIWGATGLLIRAEFHQAKMMHV